MVGELEAHAWRATTVVGNAKFVLLAIARAADVDDPDGLSRISQQKIMEATGLSRTTVQNALKSLRTLRQIEVVSEARGRGGGKVYRVPS